MDNDQILKNCFKCKQDKPRSEFYRHPAMGDGLLGKCKECTKRDVAAHRELNIEKIREYDRNRPNKEERTAQGTARNRVYRKENRERYLAHGKVARAKRRGVALVGVCVVCGATDRIELHHPDYSKPLDVVSLCSAHHRQLHVGNVKGLKPPSGPPDSDSAGCV